MLIEQAMTHPIVAYAKENLWGSAKTTIPEQFEIDFDALPPKDQQLVRAFYTGATTACGVALSLAENPKYGPAYQEKRYTSVNVWFKWLKENLPTHLSRNFGAPVELRPSKGISTFDPSWLPESKRYCLIGPATYEGFVLPRLIIDVINKPEMVYQMIDQIRLQPTILQAIARAGVFQLENGCLRGHQRSIVRQKHHLRASPRLLASHTQTS